MVSEEELTGLNNCLELVKQCCELTDEEFADITNQIAFCLNKDMKHFVINTHGRGETSKFYPLTGDRYFEVIYLTRAKQYDIKGDLKGYSREDMEQLCPDKSIWYDFIEK